MIKEHDGLGDLIVIEDANHSPIIADREKVLQVLDSLLEMV